MRRIIFFTIIIVNIFSCDNPEADGFAVWKTSDFKHKICFFNINSKMFEQCIEFKNFSSWNQIPDSGRYKRLLKNKILNNELILNTKSLRDCWDEGMWDNLKRKINNKVCDKNYFIFDSRGYREDDVGDSIPYEFDKNSYFDYIYPVWSKKEFKLQPNVDIYDRNKKLCGIKSGICEIIYGDNFFEFLSVAEGKYILIQKVCESNFRTLYSIDPITKKSTSLFTCKKNINLFPLNLQQSIVSVDAKEIYIYDHNKNYYKLFFIIPEQLKGNSILDAISKKDNYIVLLLYNPGKKENSFIIYDFCNNHNKPKIEIVKMEWSIRELRNYEQPFYYSM
jgi:hypothetical protein